MTTVGVPGEGSGSVTNSEDTVVSSDDAVVSGEASVPEEAVASGEAAVAAPAADPASDGQADEPDSGDSGEDEGDESSGIGTLEEEGDIAADYIEALLDIADLDGDIDMDVEGGRAVVSVVGATLNELVGTDGEVLEALQELTRLAVHRKTGERARLMLDVGGFRARRRLELADFGRRVADEVARTGEPQKLRAMSPFERKIIHDAIASAGLRSESEGEEPDRCVVVFPAS
ncbi:MAG: single-stranded DNA-binding protein [Nocardiopsaceae bacterium]|nr:single-stranded DNA-binding protein [Nocardiopsaceae bacterium]